MARYELLLLGQGRPELRLTDCDLALGDLVEVADQRWRVQRMSPPSGEDVELRYVLILETAEVLAGEPELARRRPRVIKADLADARDKSGVLRDAASRVRAQARRRQMRQIDHLAGVVKRNEGVPRRVAEVTNAR
jgi:hypothetical protein